VGQGKFLIAGKRNYWENKGLTRKVRGKEDVGSSRREGKWRKESSTKLVVEKHNILCKQSWEARTLTEESDAVVIGWAGRQGQDRRK